MTSYQVVILAILAPAACQLGSLLSDLAYLGLCAVLR